MTEAKEDLIEGSVEGGMRREGHISTDGNTDVVEEGGVDEEEEAAAMLMALLIVCLRVCVCVCLCVCVCFHVSAIVRE